VVEKSGKNNEDPGGMEEGEMGEAGQDLLDEVGLLLL